MGTFVKALLIKGKSAYGVLRLFTDELAAAFRAHGWTVELLDLEVEANVQRPLDDYAREAPVDLIFSFGIFGESRDAEGLYVGDLVGAPHVVQYVDYPLSHLTRLEATSPRAALLMVDETHVAAVGSIYGSHRFADVRFSPHAAIGPTVSPGADPADFAARRPIGILLPVTGYPMPPPGWRDLPPAVKAIFEQAAEIALADDWTAPLAALDQALVAAGVDIADPQFAAIRKLATYIHEHVRAVRRRQVLEAIERLNLPVHIVGAGHRPTRARASNVTVVGEARFDQVLALMAGSRMVLNINANFGAGSHERPLSAMNAGAVAATDESRFYAANFTSGVEAATYRWTSLDEDLSAIAALANDSDAAFAMAVAGQRRVVQGHLWTHRIAGIVAAANAVRAKVQAPRSVS